MSLKGTRHFEASLFSSASGAELIILRRDSLNRIISFRLIEEGLLDRKPDPSGRASLALGLEASSLFEDFDDSFIKVSCPVLITKVAEFRSVNVHPRGLDQSRDVFEVFEFSVGLSLSDSMQLHGK